jgi:hypothetical protein
MSTLPGHELLMIPGEFFVVALLRGGQALQDCFNSV